jgi:nitrate reductase NapE component
MVFDADVRRVAKRAEFKKVMAFKIILWIVFYSVFISAYVLPQNKKLIDFANLLFMIFPVVAVIYSYLLQRFNFLSYSLATIVVGSNGVL